MLDLLFGNGVMLSLHEAEPNERGQPLLSGPHDLPRAALRLRSTLLTNAAQLRLAAPERSGTVRYVGFWNPSGRFIVAVAVPAQTVQRGFATVIAAGRLRLRVGSA